MYRIKYILAYKEVEAMTSITKRTFIRRKNGQNA
ncbi:hypothetical protein [Peribacillus frigoritolerans]